MTQGRYSLKFITQFLSGSLIPSAFFSILSILEETMIYEADFSSALELPNNIVEGEDVKDENAKSQNRKEMTVEKS